MSEPSVSLRLAEDDPELIALQRHLAERDQRLEVLIAVINRLGHDFKNLLVPQIGYAAMIKDECDEQSPILPLAAKLESGTQRADKFVDVLLNAVRPRRRFSPRPGKLNSVIEAEISRWQAALPKETPITLEAQLADCAWEFDHDQWRRVISELLANAQWSLANGGALNVRLSQRNLSATQAQALGFEGNEVFELEFRDTGIGMDAPVLARAFEPLFSTRSQGIGAGLGLTMVYSVTRLHGGQLLIESDSGRGTTLTIWLPKHRPAGSPAARKPL